MTSMSCELEEAKERQRKQYPAPLTLKQLKAYPETARKPPFPKPLKQGKVQVGSTRGKAFGIHYQLYGQGSTQIIWLAGHGDRIKSWRRFALYFGYENSEKYESLFLESRGVGESEGPLGLWTMSDLATDALEALNGLGWTGVQSVNVVGHSMGGMIAQELALLCPTRIASLTLISTTSNWLADMSLWSSCKTGLGNLWPKSEDARMADMKATFFGQSWPNEPDNQEVFPTNGDNWAATSYMNQDIPYRGAILQVPACVRHKMSPDSLKRLANQIGASRIQILHGRSDKIVPFSAAERLFEQLGGRVEADLRLHGFDDTSHLPPTERFAQTRDLIEAIAVSGRR